MKLFIPFCWCFLVIGLSFAKAQDSYKIVVDETHSAIASADNLFTLYTLITEGEKQFLPTRFSEEKTFKEKLAGVSYRVGKLILVDFPLGYMTHLTQHEVFGHGARYREFGFMNSSYSLKFPPPYSQGGGFAVRGSNNRQMGRHENLLTAIGGSEASRLIADNLVPRLLSQDKINYKESILFFSSFHGYTAYILTSKLFFSRSGARDGDVFNHLRQINQYQGFPNPADYQLDINDLAQMALINLLNPFQAFSAYAYGKKYLWDGQEDVKLPMIKIKDFRYLPSVKMNLSPHGAEVYFENFLRHRSRILNLYYRQGSRHFEKHNGFGIHAYHVLNKSKFNWNIAFDHWNQPALELGGDQVYTTPGGSGSMIKTSLEFPISQLIPLNLFAQVGYKTAGYFPGEHINEGMILRLGMGFINSNKNQGTTHNAIDRAKF